MGSVEVWNGRPTMGKKRGTNTNISYGFSPVTSTKENHESVRKSYRPAGSLTYCVPVGWERTSNLTLPHPRSKVSRSGNNSFSACWPRQCPWYWKPTALGASNLQSKQLKKPSFSGSGVILHLSTVGVVNEAGARVQSDLHVMVMFWCRNELILIEMWLNIWHIAHRCLEN